MSYITLDPPREKTLKKGQEISIKWKSFSIPSDLEILEFAEDYETVFFRPVTPVPWFNGKSATYQQDLTPGVALMGILQGWVGK